MRHAYLRVAPQPHGGELATRAALDVHARPKRPLDAVEHGPQLVTAQLHFTLRDDDDEADDATSARAALASFASYVRLALVDDWATRLRPGTLIAPTHAALVDVLVDDTRLLTLPVARAPDTAWLAPLLQLAHGADVVQVGAHVAIHDDTLTLDVDAHVSPQALDRPHALPVTTQLLALLSTLDPAHDADAAHASGADLVYSSLCARERDEATRMPEAPQPRALHAHLLPFQRRSLAFLLAREAVRDGVHAQGVLGPWWVRVPRTEVYVHLLSGELTTSRAKAEADVPSAMLAEEMGLGKTVEILALLLERTAPERTSLAPFYDEANEVEVQPVGTTLIVAPETLRRQWLDEIGAHAPTLRTYSFLGHKQAAADVRRHGYASFAAWAKELDVIVVSFETLTKELAVSSTAPVRSLRRPARYERPRSPLVQLAFWRVVMDEVQLVGGNAAKTVALIRRETSIAVSGTPVRRLDDLRMCLWFLGLVPSASPTKLWQHIVSPRMAPYRAALLAQIGIRHTKAHVAHEMVLPPQERRLIPVEFTYAESAFYREAYREALDALDITEDGAPRSETWQLDTSVLRAQLLRLRQACTHPHVAWRTAGHTLDAGGHAHHLVNLRSIDQVLVMMLDGARSELLTLRHNVALKRVYRAAVLLFAPRDELVAPAPNEASVPADDVAFLASLRSEDRLALAQKQLELLLPETHEQVDELTREIEAAHREGPLYRFTDAELAAEAAYERTHTSVPYSASPDAPHDKLRARQQHVSALRNRVRHWLQMVHRVHQFLGHCYFQMGEAQNAAAEAAKPEPPAALADADAKTDAKPEQPEAVAPPVKHETGSPATSASPTVASLRAREDAAYAAAEATRQRLLTDAREAVEQCVRAMQRQRLVRRDELEPRFSMQTLLGRDVLEQVQARLATLRAHAALVVDWRTQLLERLAKPVNREVDKERENDDVYAENLDAQIEAETLLEMYRPLLAQRDELLTGRIALGATARPQLYVELDRALRVVKTRRFGDDAPAENGEEDAALAQQREAQKLQLAHFARLDAARAQVALAGGMPLAELGARLRELRDHAVRAEESELLGAAHAALHDVVRTQTQLVERLRKEQAVLQACFNARSVYFKQMQELSDQVQDPEMPDGAVPSLLAARAQERAWRQRIGAVEGRVRYLTHLEQIQGGHADDEARRCFICTNLIETGILTNACGHLCCQACFYAWMKQGRRTCPMCKTKLTLNDVHRVVFRSPDADADTSGAGAHTARGAPAYRTLPDALRTAIERTPSQGRYGSKLDLLTKHLLYLHRTTREKSLVFSSFARGLDLVAESLRANGVPYARLEGGGSRRVGATVDAFQHTDVPVLLLHSEVQSAGLNLLAATHLFLLEPLMNHALELQAIGRVHRIGQTRATHVYCYMVHDTVEQRIVALAASRAQCLYVARDADADAADAMDSAALQATHLEHAEDVSREARRGDLMGSTDDLLACLFQEHIPTDDAPPVPPGGAPSLDELRARRLAALPAPGGAPPP